MMPYGNGCETKNRYDTRNTHDMNVFIKVKIHIESQLGETINYYQT